MSFYEEISNYYDYIFPIGEEQIDFISKNAGNPPKSLLDIACGTGSYSIELARQGYYVVATDIDAEMIRLLEGKISDLAYGDYKIKCMQAGMLDLTEKLHEKYDLAFCIGNSVVHLDGKDDIQAFFKSVKMLLKEDGCFVLQIINFDRVLSKGIKELPVITNKEVGLKFDRYYRLDKEKNKVLFKTILTINGSNFNGTNSINNINTVNSSNSSNIKIENEIPLFPLMSEDAAAMLKEAGFKTVNLFGDFSGNKYDKDNSYMLVISAFC